MDYEETVMAGELHKQLVATAEKWLKYRCVLPHTNLKRENLQRFPVKCAIVLTEIVTAANETPDAIGWWCGTSVLIEVKVSRSDYYRDKTKFSRRVTGYGIGNYRYYMTPPGLLVQKNMPEGWGLLEVDGKKVNVVKLPTYHDSNVEDEKRILLSVIRRMMQKSP